MKLIIKKDHVELLDYFTEDPTGYTSEKILLKYINYIVYNNSLTIASIHTIKGSFNYWVNSVENRIPEHMVKIDNREKDFVKYYINVNNIFKTDTIAGLESGEFLVDLKLIFVSSNEDLLLIPSSGCFDCIKNYLI